ncbi:TonB-dependent receptor [Sphingomonas sp. BT-65]|uniref:TonB-dependent receptor n=1 Tax=Sphingomonas sp. BT-65 TaxID=2989821 RepID=UPI002235D64A|nr:TonB-dependent receptor [Sphingomonas sp. BT-65]MCW4460896.1 TonB-dependent receptor [Sphingomonas sp. BT-65]
MMAGSSLAAMSAAHAQDKPQGQTAASADPQPYSDDIVVTAQKREERLLSVPVPVTAVSADRLLSEGRTRIEDYFSQVPGLSLLASGSGQNTLAIRGISTSSSTNPTVGIVIDDVPFGASSVTSYSSRLIPDLDPSDLARIEVLRGPQGTLYGASSMGGLLKYVTVAPSTAGVSGRVQANIEQIDGGGLGYGARAALNLPLGDDIALRVSGFGRRTAGFVDNLTTGEDNVDRSRSFGGRAALLWQIADNVSWTVSALAQDTKGNGANNVDVANISVLNAPLTQTRMPGTGQYRSKVTLVTSNLQIDWGDTSLVISSGYNRSVYRSMADSSPAYGPIAAQIVGVSGATFAVDYNTEKLTQEIRVERKFGEHADLTLGGYFGNERTHGAQIIDARVASTGSFFANLATIKSQTKLDELAGFGTLTLHFGRFSLQGGGRYARNEQSYPRDARGPLIGNGFSNVHSESGLFSYLISPQFNITDKVMLYGRVATGYRIGGPNPNAAAGAPASYAPDKTTNYELGLKGTFFDRLATVDASLFHIDWNNIQLSLSNPLNGLTYFTNGPRAKSEGAELALTLAPGGGLTVAATGTYNVAELTTNLPAGGGYGLDGDRLPFSSRYAGSVSADERFAIGGSAQAFVGATLTYVGKRYGDFQRTAALVRTVMPAYTTVDLRAGVDVDKWSLSLFASNVGDKRGIIGGTTNGLQQTPTGPFNYIYIRPRTFGVSVAKRF